MVRIQDDFDNAVNETWKKENPIPDIYPRYTNFTKLDEELEKLKIEMCKNKYNPFILIFNDIPRTTVIQVSIPWCQLFREAPMYQIFALAVRNK